MANLNTERAMALSAAIRRHSETIRALAAHHRAANPRLFGSALHGKATTPSDVDILVDALPGATLFDLGELQMELQELLGVPVDLLTPADISPRFRRSVLNQATAI